MATSRRNHTPLERARTFASANSTRLRSPWAWTAKSSTTATTTLLEKHRAKFSFWQGLLAFFHHFRSRPHSVHSVRLRFNQNSFSRRVFDDVTAPRHLSSYFSGGSGKKSPSLLMEFVWDTAQCQSLAGWLAEWSCSRDDVIILAKFSQRFYRNSRQRFQSVDKRVVSEHAGAASGRPEVETFTSQSVSQSVSQTGVCFRVREQRVIMTADAAWVYGAEASLRFEAWVRQTPGVPEEIRMFQLDAVLFSAPRSCLKTTGDNCPGRIEARGRVCSLFFSRIKSKRWKSRPLALLCVLCSLCFPKLQFSRLSRFLP